VTQLLEQKRSTTSAQDFGVGLFSDIGLFQVALAAKVNKALEQKFLEVHELRCASFYDKVCGFNRAAGASIFKENVQRPS
jgi:hypothetical protein